MEKLGHVDNMPGIVLTKQRHRVITNRWMEELRRARRGEKGRYANITREDIFNAALKVYSDDPVQKQVVVRYLLNLLTH